MNDAERLESIREKLSTAAASSQVSLSREDVEFLLARVADLEKKNTVLSRHVLELTEEMENVRMDFGGGR